MSQGLDGVLPEASVHGRFQPFHNGHLEYVEAAVRQSDYLYVGITQHVVKRLIQVSSADAVHRAEPQSNPLTYFERRATIDAVLRNLGIGRDRYEIIPFPIEEPDQLSEFLPVSVPILTTTYDGWNAAKIALLENLGYDVVNLWSRDHKDVAGHDIRALIRDGNAAWRDQVPPDVADLLDAFGIEARLRSLAT